MPIPKVWYCGHCSYGPMTIANNDHCCICHHQRDAYATYEVQETDALNSPYHTLPPAPSTYRIDSKFDRPSSSIEEPQRSLSIGLDPGWGPPLPNRERAYATRPPISACRTMCDPHPPPPYTTWYCCQCLLMLTTPFYIRLITETGRDGPKSIRLEPKCLVCNHQRCKSCRKCRNAGTFPVSLDNLHF